ncbi:MAG TPA: Uma2 family endonuclease [Pyrinomonadaceae bacterium]|nr:Uma2 family endonuclease [Pyrinomonadaceae bacterium]
MSVLSKKKRYTPNEYLALEEKAEYRSEYENGEIIAMAGGSLNHQQITANFTEFLSAKIRKKGCRVLPSEMKIWVESNNKFYYPDVTIVCEKPKFYHKRNDTIENPKLLIEVLSKATEAKDRGEKFFAFQTLESLQEYVLVSQDKHLVETFTKQTDGSWRYLATIGLESEVYFDSVEEKLKISEIYDLVEFE